MYNADLLSAYTHVIMNYMYEHDAVSALHVHVPVTIVSEPDPRTQRGSGSETTVTNATLMNLTSIMSQLLSV